MIRVDAVKVAVRSPVYWRFSTRIRLGIIRYITKTLEDIVAPKYIKLRKDTDPWPSDRQAFENYLKVLNKEDRENALRAEKRKSVGVYEVREGHINSKEHPD